ncbi:MAG: IS4 family transposase [Nitrospirota bacterium]|nr:IS4 family transposase [Nitrospirota bacterium]
MTYEQDLEIDYHEQPTIFDKLLEPVHAVVEDQAQQLPPTRRQTYPYPMFFRTLICYFASGLPSLKLFISTRLNQGLLPDTLNLTPVPYNTFRDAFERYSPHLFRTVFEHLIATLPLRHIPELAAFGTLYCIDGSLFPIISSMAWAAYTSHCQALRLHMCFELNRMIPVDFLVGTGKSSERDALRAMLVAGVTYIADRGYMCFKLFHDIAQAKSSFVFRVKQNLVYETIQTLKLDLPPAVQGLFHDVTDEQIRCSNDPYDCIYRLVRFRVAAEYYYIMTNRFELSTFEIIMLYAYRWQVELLFRFLKRTMNGIHLVKNTNRGVTIQFYALVITALLELHLKQHIMDQYDEDHGETPVENDTQDGYCLSDPKARLLDTGQFLKMIGDKLKRYWKIGIHWLTAFRSLLGDPFDKRAIEILGST